MTSVCVLLLEVPTNGAVSHLPDSKQGGMAASNHVLGSSSKESLGLASGIAVNYLDELTGLDPVGEEGEEQWGHRSVYACFVLFVEKAAQFLWGV